MCNSGPNADFSPESAAQAPREVSARQTKSLRHDFAPDTVSDCDVGQKFAFRVARRYSMHALRSRPITAAYARQIGISRTRYTVQLPGTWQLGYLACSARRQTTSEGKL